MKTREEKKFIELERIETTWILRWVLREKKIIKEMSFECREEAFSLMCLYLKSKKCAWIETREKKLKYRVYAI